MNTYTLRLTDRQILEIKNNIYFSLLGDQVNTGGMMEDVEAFLEDLKEGYYDSLGDNPYIDEILEAIDLYNSINVQLGLCTAEMSYQDIDILKLENRIKSLHYTKS